jgi:hypothetical protein
MRACPTPLHYTSISDAGFRVVDLVVAISAGLTDQQEQRRCPLRVVAFLCQLRMKMTGFFFDVEYHLGFIDTDLDHYLSRC